MNIPTLFSLGDLRQAVRRLSRERGFTTTVLLTLALCIGANVAIFAVVDAILVRSLPFPDADRLLSVVNSYPKAGVERGRASLVNYYDRRTAIKAFGSTSIIKEDSATIGVAGSPSSVSYAAISPEFFMTLGVPLAAGRSFTREDMSGTPETGYVAVIADEFWRTRFQGDSQVLGKTFTVEGVTSTVVGVLPPGFRYLSSRAQFFIPVMHRPEDLGAGERHNGNYQMIVRLAPGATLADAQAQMDAFDAQQATDDPNLAKITSAGYCTLVQGLHADHVRTVKPILLLLQGGVLCLLLIGGVNLVNLLLIRANGRAREFAVRQALGASPRHIIRDVLADTVLLAFGGGLFGIALGAAGIQLLSVLGAAQLPLGATIAFDGRVATIALIGSLIVGVLLALPVIWFNFHANPAPVLQSETRGSTASRAAQRLRHGFVVTQVALAFVLLAGAGLLGVSLDRVLQTAPGFRPDQVLTGRVTLPGKRYAEMGQRRAALDRLMADLRTQPGVGVVGFTSNLPMTNSLEGGVFMPERTKFDSRGAIIANTRSAIMGSYWQALGIPLIAGRFLENADSQTDQKVCVVDEVFAQRYWSGQNAIGQRIVNQFYDKEAYTIVGIVGSVKQNDLAELTALGAIYVPFASHPWGPISIVLRTSLAPEAMAAVLRQSVLKLDPELSVDEVKPMQAWMDQSLIARRSPAVLACIFAGVALLLVVVGTYGVLAYAVSQRRREIGVRMAIGALPSQIMAQFLGLGGRLLVVGLILGGLGAWAAGRAIQSLLFGIGAVHLGVFAATAGVMMVVVFLAVFLPAFRASRVSPLETLRDN